MSDTYSISNHQPQFNADFSELEIHNLTTGTIEETYDLTQSTKVSVTSGNYVVDQNTCTGCFSQSFDADEQETVSFSGARMAGVTIMRLEGTLKPHLEYDFDLDACPVYLKYDGDKLKVEASQDSGGAGFDPCCVTIRQLTSA
ncbi:MAG: hypothetical protein AAGN35_10670 [Bacteroidota bacterium]